MSAPYAPWYLREMDGSSSPRGNTNTFLTQGLAATAASTCTGQEQVYHIFYNWDGHHLLSSRNYIKSSPTIGTGTTFTEVRYPSPAEMYPNPPTLPLTKPVIYTLCSCEAYGMRPKNDFHTQPSRP